MIEFNIGDLVWAKMKGYSPWPGRVSVPCSELYAQKNTLKYVCIYFFGSNNYQWVKRDKLKPYKEFKEKLMKYCNTAALSQAIKQIEEYIDNPKGFGEIDGQSVVTQINDFLEDAENVDNQVVKQKNILESKMNILGTPYVKLEKTEIFQCETCSKVFLTSQELEKHLFDPIVLLERKKFFSCKKCNGMFADSSDYKKHVLGYVKASYNQLRRKEFEVDSGKFKKRYFCPECNQGFVQQSTLEAHSRVHDPYPHVCHCGVGFRQQYDLIKHKQLVHNEGTDIVAEKIITKKRKRFKINRDDEKEVKVTKAKIKKPRVVYKDDDDVSEHKDNSSSEDGSDEVYKTRIKVKIGPKFKAQVTKKPNKNKTKRKKRKQPQKHNCKYCPEKLTNINDLDWHYIDKHPEEKPYQCVECDVVLKSKITFTRHCNKAHKVHRDKVTCTYCNKQFASKNNLQIHYRIHTKEKPFACDVCGKCFSQTGAMKIHKMRHTYTKNFKCRFCDKAFYDIGSLKLHERIHTGFKPYKCEICSKSFSDPSAFNRHTRVHTGEKPYSCKYCPKTFSDNSSYSIHTKRHENQKDFECSICEKAFITLDNLRRHLSTHLEVEKKFECDYCGLKFLYKSYLFTHIKGHMIPGQSCNICSTVCKGVITLKTHQYIAHKIGQPLTCEKCAQIFWTIASINDHKLNCHRKKKTFNCHHCSKKFHNKSYLRRHIIKKHLRWPNCLNCNRYFAFKSYQSHLVRCRGTPCDICHETIPYKVMEAHVLSHIKT